MWIEAGFAPDAFYIQTPRHFQLAMQGVRARLESEADARLSLAWSTGAFSGAASAGKLKPLRHYIKKPPRKMSAKEMLANMNMLATRVNRKFGDS
jgi:hypothetical protein